GTILRGRGERKLILVATSGDTGSAVGSAFLGKKSIDVKILFPKGMVSQRQKAQLCAFSGNVSTYQVEGTFDDCQRMVKEAFMDSELNSKYDFSSANSINIARLIPQMTYYFYASLKFLKDRGRKPVIIVPTGNAGNVTAAYYALLMGAPIKRLFLACNSNHSITDYLRTGEYKGHKTIKTLANAMDVGNPSNMERLMSLFPKFEDFKANVDALCVSDDEIRQTISDYYKACGSFICPHTACSVYALNKRFSDSDDVVAVSTASPVKFSDVIRDVLGVAPPEDERFMKIISGKQQFTEIKADYHQLFV
ncbi:MAG TPA: threonine synthase, partial [Spirochaetaceae bacterium]|nr:threonine synthase [Spirochaetaceae bacterium]